MVSGKLNGGELSSVERIFPVIPYFDVTTDSNLYGILHLMASYVTGLDFQLRKLNDTTTTISSQIDQLGGLLGRQHADLKQLLTTQSNSLISFLKTGEMETKVINPTILGVPQPLITAGLP
jgi:hypothetical protein